MKSLSRSKIGTTLIVFVTLVLAGVAIFTAYRLYQLRQTSVAPNVPSSNPKADTISSTPTSNCSLAFTLSTATATATATATSTATATATATSYPSGSPNSCGGTCGSDANCMSGYYICYNGFCRDKSCPTDPDCTCDSTASASASATAAALPQSGTNWPTLAGASFGIIIVLSSLLLAI